MQVNECAPKYSSSKKLNGSGPCCTSLEHHFRLVDVGKKAEHFERVIQKI